MAYIYFLIETFILPGVVVHTANYIPRKAEAEGYQSFRPS
jgi:hypothetical protein